MVCQPPERAESGLAYSGPLQIEREPGSVRTSACRTIYSHLLAAEDFMVTIKTWALELHFW
jgi:hypothetical protein